MADTLTVTGSICSIAAFLLTLWILLKLRSVHRGFLFQARLPELRKKIGRHRADLSRLLNTFPDSRAEVAAEIRKCHANLQSLKAKLGGGRAAGVKALFKQTRDFARSSVPFTKEQVGQIYLGLVFLEEELENLSEDIKWRPRE